MTIHKLAEYSEVHLLHELEQFEWAAQSIPEEDSPLHNAVLESFVIHLRNLVTFFIADARANLIYLLEIFSTAIASGTKVYPINLKTKRGAPTGRSTISPANGRGSATPKRVGTRSIYFER